MLKRCLIVVSCLTFIFAISSCPKETAKPIGKEYLPKGTHGGPMVYVPAGDFIMGSENSNDAERLSHTIYLDAFYIDKYEVTVEQYSNCMSAGKCTEISIACECEEKKFNEGDYPRWGASWYHAKAYCEYAGKRLPTEAEWEKAARGTDGRLYPWGNQEPTCDLAIYFPVDIGEGCGDSIMPVGSKPRGASPYGAMDMAGNVAEWVSDWYAEGYYSNSPRRNPTGPSSGTERVVRGVPFYFDLVDLGVSSRFASEPDNSAVFTGFRCAKLAE